MHLYQTSKFWTQAASFNMTTVAARAASKIANNSFEYPAVAEGSYDIGVPGWGWTGGDAPQLQAKGW